MRWSGPAPISSAALLAQQPTAATLIADIRSGDEALRQRAVEQAVLVGTPLIVPLGQTMGGGDAPAASAAEEALRRVAHHCARPRASAERRAAARELLKLTSAAFPRAVRVEALHLLGLVGAGENASALGDPAFTGDAEPAAASRSRLSARSS